MMPKHIGAFVLVTCLLGSAALAAPDGTNVWYGGGSYDGASLQSASAGVYPLCVNNAGGATNVMPTSAWLNGTLVATSNGEPATVYVFWGVTDGGTNLGNWANTNEFGSVAEGQSLTVNVVVTPNTTNYYRFYATNEAGAAWAASSATFLTPGPPVLTSGLGAIPVGPTFFTANGNLTAGGTSAVYVLYGLNTNAWSGTNSLGVLNPGAFARQVSSLDQGASYYYRCYGTNAYGEGWSDIVAFTTRVGVACYYGGSFDGYSLSSNAATVYAVCVNNANGATGATDTNAWLNGTLVATSNGAATVRVYWGATDGGTNRDNWAHTNEFGTADEGQTLTTNVSVGPNTTYYYRFYGTNQGGEGWAPSSASFLTPGPPIFTSGLGAIPVGPTFATLNGNLTTGGISTVYVLYGMNTNAWSGTNSLGVRSPGVFARQVSSLDQGASYYYRCYGTNAYGAGWSDIVAFTTRVGVACYYGGSYDGYSMWSNAVTVNLLTIDDLPATAIAGTNATLNGRLACDGGDTNTTLVICWGYTNAGATVTGAWPNAVSLGSGWKAITEFSNTVYNLLPGSSYVYRCYATNTTGSVWSAAQSFTTVTLLALTATVNNGGGASNITATTAEIGGNLTLGFGTAAVTVYWGESDGGTNKNSWDNPGLLGDRSAGAFSTNISGLKVDTLYYYRTYASSTYGDVWASETSLWMAQTRTKGGWHLVSVPANYTSKTLNSVLGRALASGMTPGTGPTDDSLWLQDSSGAWTGWHWLTSSTNWMDKTSGMASSNEVQLGIAVWLKRATTGQDTNIAVFAGTQPTNSAQMTFPNASWRAFGWPYAAKHATAGTGTNIGWGFAAQGGTRSNSANNSDMIMAEYSGKWHQVYLGVDSNWYERGTRTITSIELKPGKGYFYYHRGATMNWTAQRY